MAYALMMTQIKRGKMSKEELTKKANVFFMAGQLTDEQYVEIIGLINEMEG